MPESAIESESSFEAGAALEHVSDAVAVVDEGWRCLYFNAAFERMVGQDRQQMLGKNCWELAPAALGTEFEEQFRKAMAQQVPVDFEAFYPRLNIWVEALGFPSPHLLTLFFRDITQRKQAEKDHRASERRFRDLVEATSDWVWEVDANATYTYVSPRVREMLGYEPNDVLGKTPFDLMPPAEARRVAALFGPIAAAQKPLLCLINTNLHKDGHAVVLETSGVPIYRQDGTFCGYRGIDRDVTQHKQFEDALWASEARHRAIFDLATVGLAEGDPRTGRFLNVNQRLCDILGYRREELLAMYFRDMTHPEDREADDKKLRAMLADPTICYRNDKRYVRKDGKIVWAEVSAQAVRDEQGEPLRIVAAISDITERTQAKAALDAASKAKDHFLAVLSHELRTPLTPVLTTAQIMEADTTLSPKQQEAISMIRRNVELQARLIDDLLDLTRVTRGKLELNCTTVDLHEYLGYVIAMCQSGIAAKQLQLTVTTQATHHIVSADAARLQQILWNLLKNAVKFTPVGGSITVRTHNSDDGCIVVGVQDTGVGIDADALPRLFDAFEQGGAAVTRQFGGLGLGLAISKALTDLHGGTLTAQSKGRCTGATFALTLRTAAGTPSQRPCAGGIDTLRALAAGRRVLVVEDHADSAKVMSNVLTRYGFAVSLAYSVAEAIESAQSNPFDLLISDIGLPDGSGLDVMRQVAAIKPIKGIAISGFGMEEDRRQSKGAGFSAHLTKPVTLTVLERALVKVLTAAQIESGTGLGIHCGDGK